MISLSLLVDQPVLMRECDVRWVQREMNRVESLLARITEQPDEHSGCDYDVLNGVAVIPVEGIIFNKEEWWFRYVGWTSCERIRRQHAMAMDDGNVHTIVYVFDTPGGIVNGVGDTSDLIYQTRGRKPVIAMVDDQCCSAGIYIGSACDRMFVTQSSDVGSIGVYRIRYDFTGNEKQNGIESYVIRAGKEKAYGHPSLPMTPDELKSGQADVDSLYSAFIAAVARNRGVTAEQAAKQWGDARCWRGQAAVDVGLAEKVTTFDRVMSELGSAGLDVTNERDQQDVDSDDSPGADSRRVRPRICRRIGSG